ncbi:hypothetical protein WN944_015554 [Citrus x changshan-huyou]|uniref:AB hydrolase-1 domain-containing protein n=1 Tax=Citrus x changshan-huyou TaxID=2935761 RepID=A0AAP0M9A0_9ROSI
MEAWAQLILDFLDEIVQKPTVLIGNSVGSLACVIAASESSQTLVRGLVLLNCAGGMNKAIVDDWRIKLLLPLLWFIDFLLKQRPIASAIFERVKQRETLRNILLSIYANKESVDETLVEIIREPANVEGALDAFVSIVTGPPGPNPVQLMPSISIPLLVLWGDEDPFTPLDGPVGKYFSSLPSKLSNVKLIVLKGVGHCPHDDRPELVHEKLLPWSKYPSLSRRSIDEGSSSIAVPLKNNQLILPDEISGSLFSFGQPERSSLVRNSKLNIPDGRLFRLLLPLRFKITSLFRRGINVGFGILAISLWQAAWIIWFNLL